MSAAEATRRRDVLFDSQATLRQVESVLSGLGSRLGPEVDRDERVERVVSTLESRRSGLKDLVSVLVTTYMEITSVIEALRQSRGLLEQAAMDRLQSTHEKLNEVSTATELATTGMLDSLDRSLVLVDQLEQTSGADAPSGAQLRERLRDELHAMINLLQFQDITAQQLGCANGVLLDIEERMVELSRIFDLRWLGLDDGGAARDDDAAAVPKSAVHATCDPMASHFDADTRQALADEIFR
jgi:hypothetical protein